MGDPRARDAATDAATPADPSENPSAAPNEDPAATPNEGPAAARGEDPAAAPGDLLGADGPFARRIEGWSPRPSQQAMADAVFRALRGERHLVLEAPTGVGKTLGYLLPAALSGRRVIISTHTKNLQDQLLDKDLPRLGAALADLGIDLARSGVGGDHAEHEGRVHYAVMKGRTNYLCLDRLHRRTRQRSLPLLAPPRHESVGELSDAELLEEIADWARGSPRGDRAELPGLPERSALWDVLDARSDSCHGHRCPQHQACFVTRMREEGERAELVVVNHYLLFADLALRARAELAGGGAGGRFGQVLPDADLVILDEAHTLEAIAAEHFGGTVGAGQLERLLKDVTALVAEQGMLRDPAGLVQAVARAASAGGACFAELPRADHRVALRATDPRFAGLRAAGERVHAAIHELIGRLDDAALLEPRAEGLARRGREVAEALRFVLEGEDPDYVYWAEGQGAKAKLGASPVDVARLLGRFLFDRFDSVVLTSATLSAGDDECRYFNRSVGVPEGTATVALDSSFDYRAQAALLVPAEAPEPGQPGAEAIVAELAERAILAVGGGALFLCTSHRAMRAMHRRLAPRLPFPCLLQGERPKRALLAELVEQAPAVLFATQSFWEGVDVPGDALRLVLMDRLPFGVPTDPLVRARGERLEAEGKSAFAHDQLPRAILRLKQGFGRLIRTDEDRGVVVLLDGRVHRRAYGRRFLDALPPAQRLSTFEALEAWWGL